MPRRHLAVALALAAGSLFAGCGEQGIELSKSDPDYEGAKIFQQRCSGCHSLSVVGTQGSASDVHSREYKDGPNFNVRKEDYQSVLYAIRNGGFSSGPMPQNIVVGEEAEAVACFVAKYSGNEVSRSASPGAQKPTDEQGGGDEATSQSPAETGANCPK
jgi:mono/diheme cytochrome c family protein